MTTALEWSGRTLMGGGALAAITNGVLTPLLPHGSAFAELASSTVFRVRMSLATVVTLCLVVGCIGLCIVHVKRMKVLGAISFLLALLGSAAAFAHEWAQIFYIHHIALTAPQALNLMENVNRPNLFDAEAAIALGGLTLGWSAFCAYMLSARVVGRTGPSLVLASVLALPLLAVAAPIMGQVVGAIGLAAGWCRLGWDISRLARAHAPARTTDA
ncbi:MAG: hypothetical protein AAGA68_20795 [Pseudomonadota bacterium]